MTTEISELYGAIIGQVLVHESVYVIDLCDFIGLQYHVDRECIVAAMWDLVDDEVLVYDARAHVRMR